MTKLPIALSAPAKPETHINDETSTFIPDSPFKRNILGDIDNLLPSSPDLLSVPETPKCQMRLFLSSSTEKNDWSPQACRQMSPISCSPLSREPRMRQILSIDEGKTISNFSCTRKRLISPPQESHCTKKSMNSNGLTQTVHSLNITRPFKVMQSDVHNKANEMFISAKRIRETSVRNGTMENKTGYIFTQNPGHSKACEKLNPHPHVNTHAGAGHELKSNLTTATYALLKTEEKGGMDCNKKDTMRTEINSSKGEGDNGTSNPEGARGIVIQLWVVVF